jgi:hypothetical protein
VPTFLFLLAAYGVCFGLMNDKAPFVPSLRKLPLFPDTEGRNFFSRMFACPYCTGFHAGWLVWLVLRLPLHLGAGGVVNLPLVLGEALAHAFAASAFCYLADIAAEWVEGASQ